MSWSIRSWEIWLACLVLVVCSLGGSEPSMEAATHPGKEPAPLRGRPGGARRADMVRRRALLIGINDYSASTLAPAATVKERSAWAGGRDWPNLGGAVNDVQAMRE